jgi:Caspase domain
VADGRFALIVASSRYTDPTLTQLEAPAHDARALATVLGTEAVGDFEVTTLTDEPAPKVMQEIEAFLDDRRRDDLVLLYFSGHGILDEGARLYFATADTRVDRPRSTAVSADFVNDLMSECRSRRQVLMLDCCNSGAFARGIKAGGNIGTGERFEGRGRVVITASDALQYAFEGDRIEGQGINSVFTRHLVDGLQTGAADLNGDGRVTLDELYDYVYGQVLDSSSKQRPRKWAFGVEGQIYIASTGVEAPVPAAAEVLPAAIEPAPPTVVPSAAKQEPGRPWYRRPMAWIAALVALVALIAGGILLLRDDDSGSSSSSSPPVDAERNAALAVFEAWQTDTLDRVPDSDVSAAARRALGQMPIQPITPTPPAPNDCSGEPGDADCPFYYPGLDVYLDFVILKYSTGLRVADIRCYTTSTGDLVAGGMPACARIIRNS